MSKIIASKLIIYTYLNKKKDIKIFVSYLVTTKASGWMTWSWFMSELGNV